MHTIIIGWETRNRRRSADAVRSCMNYGLTQITRTTYIGALTVKEREVLRRRLQQNFTKSTDRFYLLLLCDTCVPLATLPEKTTAGVARNQTPFEFIAVKENM